MGIAQVEKIFKWLKDEGFTLSSILSIIGFICLSYGLYTINMNQMTMNKKLDSTYDMMVAKEVEIIRLEFEDIKTMEEAQAKVQFWYDNGWNAQISSAKFACAYAKDSLKETLFPPEIAQMLCARVSK